MSKSTTEAVEAPSRDGKIRALRERVSRATEASGELRRLASALALVDPAEALEWMLAEEAEVREALSGEERADLLDTISERLGDRSAGSPDAQLLSLLETYREDARAETISGAMSRGEPTAEERDRIRGLLQGVLERHPRHPGLLRRAAELAVADGRASDAHDLLNRLGEVEPRQATVQWIRNTRSSLPATDAPEARVALLSSFTTDPLLPYVDLECRQLGLRPELYAGPFNAWAQEVLDPESDLYDFEPDIVFLAVSLDDLIPDLSRPLGGDELEERGDDAVERILTIARRFRDRRDAVLVVHSLHSAHRDPFETLGGRGAPDRTAWLQDVNLRLRSGIAEITRAYTLDVQETLLRREGGEADRPKMRHMARMRLVDAAAAEVARAYARYIAPVKGLTRKCVVLDLDNTLWGGIVGEDGPHGIQIGTTAPGSEYREFQEYMLSLTERGILLAVNSKNNPGDARPVLRDHPDMVLQEEHFSAIRTNWDPKPENMRSIADELNIGLDSLVFLDDNPHERELMRQALPQVLTPELPSDPARYRRTVEELPQLQALEVTETDRTRVEQYRSRQQREEFEEEAATLDDYLHSLGIEVEVRPADDSTLPRVHQLVERTNQFNLTARRYDRGTLEGFVEDPAWRVLTLRARDRFGDHGLVAVAIVEEDGETWRIDSFMMSCRVIGYGVETALLSVVEEQARAAGATLLEGEVIETEKNMPARDLYEEHGFSPTASEDGRSVWALELPPGDAESIELPDWIGRSDGHEA